MEILNLNRDNLSRWWKTTSEKEQKAIDTEWGEQASPEDYLFAKRTMFFQRFIKFMAKLSGQESDQLVVACHLHESRTAADVFKLHDLSKKITIYKKNRKEMDLFYTLSSVFHEYTHGYIQRHVLEKFLSSKEVPDEIEFACDLMNIESCYPLRSDFDQSDENMLRLYYTQMLEMHAHKAQWVAECHLASVLERWCSR